jgi:hypothetical protein
MLQLLGSSHGQQTSKVYSGSWDLLIFIAGAYLVQLAC